MNAPPAPPASPALRGVLDALGEQSLLGALYAQLGPCRLLDHWKQGEFHHDLVFEMQRPRAGLGPFLVASTNCNGGVKEIIALGERPARWALWHHRCPDNPAFEGQLAPIQARIRTMHWFEPGRLLRPGARSELRVDARRRQRGGGWIPLDSVEESETDWLAGRGDR